jgi:hypothetical protein
MKKFYASGTLTHQDKSMTAILLRMYSHIDTGKIFNPARERPDSNVMATRTDEHKFGYTGFSLDDFNCVHRDKNLILKRGLHQCSRVGHTPPSRMFSSVQSQPFVRH